MKQAYKDLNLRPATLRHIHLLNNIINEYLAQGFTLSVRQLYYQLVARGIVENTEQSYKSTAKVINDGRVCGLIDWDAIEDRNRDIEERAHWTSGSSILRGAADSFHMDMWEGQTERVFVIVEKAALAGVLGPLCRRYDVPLLAARGYPSVSIVRELVEDYFVPAMQDDQVPCVLHLGDHDPSGIDMTRDLRERIEMFVDGQFDFEVDIDRIALNMPQIEEKRPPPNPAKTTDARYKEYRKRYGNESWELDALEPAYLVDLVERKIKASIDALAWDERHKEIESIRERLTKVAEEFEAA